MDRRIKFAAIKSLTNGQVPLFYRQIGQNLSQWKKPAPKIKETSDSVDVEAISKEAEEY